MVAEQQYRYLVDQVYWVDNLRSENSLQKKMKFIIINKNPKIRPIPKVLQNQRQHLQRRRWQLLLWIKGNVDYSHVVIVMVGRR